MNELLFISIQINELETLIQKSVRKVLSEKSEALQPPLSDRCELSEAVKITGLSRSQLYKNVHFKKIPFQKFGKRLIFSRKELLSWIEEQTTSPIPQDDEMTARLRISANKKFNK